jgi:hypothetical protein
MNIQTQKELIKKKHLEWFIQKEELKEAMNKLPIYERAIIKEVLLQIQNNEINNKNCKQKAEIEAICSARLDDLLKKQKKRAEEQQLATEQKNKILKMKAVGLLSIGTLVYVYAAIITR